jgi:hypothetical protein
MSGSSISQASFGSTLSSRVRTKGSSGSALSVSGEFFSEFSIPSILVRSSEMSMAMAFKWGGKDDAPGKGH